MSNQLREALRKIKAEADAPVVYLHDPDTGEPFGALLSIELEAAHRTYADADGAIAKHSHLAGDEDE